MNTTTHHLSARLREIGDMLDDLSIDVGNYHISVFNALWMGLVIIAALAFAQFGGRLVRYLMRRARGLDTAQQVLGEKLITLMIWAFAFFTAIDQLGISLTAFTVFSGAFGLAIGFGLQKTFGNMIAGIILLLDRSIKPGDVIAVSSGTANTIGVVHRIGIRAVSVTTLDNRVYLIPNENLMTGQVENWSYSSPRVSVSIPVSIACGSDIDLAEELLMEVVRGVPRVLEDPGPSVLVTAITAASIDLSVSCWVDDPQNGVGGIKSAVLKDAWRVFRERGVAMPTAQTALVLGDSDALQQLLAAVKPDATPAPAKPEDV